MKIVHRVTSSLLALLVVVGLSSSCGTPAPQLEMEVSTLGMARVGDNVVVRVAFRNLPQEGSDIDVAWYGFGVEGRAFEATIEAPSLPGASGERKKMSLLWESSNADILGGHMEAPGIYSPDGANLPSDAQNVGIEFFFEALSAGTTDLELTLTRPSGSVIKRMIEVTVVR